MISERVSNTLKPSLLHIQSGYNIRGTDVDVDVDDDKDDCVLTYSVISGIGYNIPDGRLVSLGLVNSKMPWDCQAPVTSNNNY